MPQVVVPATYLKVDLTWLIPGPVGKSMNTFGVHYDNIADDAEIDAGLVAAFTPVAENAGSGSSLDHLTIHVGGAAPPYLARDVNVGVQGTQGADALPANVSCLIQKRTLTPGREGRGRTYLGGFLVESEVETDSTILPTPLAGFQTMADNLLEDLAADPLLGMYVLHLAGSSDTTPSAVTSFLVQGVVATQRRRLR